VKAWLAVVLALKACGIALAAGHLPVAGALVFFAPDPWVFLQFVLPSAQGFGPAATAFATDRREVWLTIDDGPDPGTTPRVLELLRAHGARATFFVVGAQVRRHPELARRIAAEGHSIGNHTESHPAADFWLASPRRIASEIDRCAGALLAAGAPFEPYFRPPVGVRNPFLSPQLSARGMDLVLWSARGLDGVGRDPHGALRRIARGIRPGAILLSHEGGATPEHRLRFVELLLERLAREGYSCVLPPRAALRRGARGPGAAGP
jgi:peptidoglycan/xylan/chitin deacetylase (PgdA/CDA1 family)